MPDLRRRIPQVAKLLDRPGVRAAIEARGRAVVDRVLQEQVARIRALAEAGAASATGVVVHTNLGRAPLSKDVAGHVASLAASYTNLEFDLEAGSRGHREKHAEGRLQAMLGAGGSVVVNNNAAAVLLAVNTFAEGREVLVSRGELVEIGGSFRIPEILRKGGARLREVGTTNRTRIADYANAITPETGLILRVHPSNFRIVGFTESAELRELVALGRDRGITVVEDLGSGLLESMPAPLSGEATIAASLAAGVDVVTASGDKLLGGPQAGLLVGRREAVDALRRNPLYRALRVDKMTIAALDAVLARHEAGRREDLPVPRMLALPADAVGVRAQALRDRLAAAAVPAALDVRATGSAVGGGAAPDIELPSFALAVRPTAISIDALARRLRAAATPVVARIDDDALLFDSRTMLEGDDEELAEILAAVLKESVSE